MQEGHTGDGGIQHGKSCILRSKLRQPGIDYGILGLSRILRGTYRVLLSGRDDSDKISIRLAEMGATLGDDPQDHRGYHKRAVPTRSPCDGPCPSPQPHQAPR
jgi:hypothetical protein